MDSSFSRFWFRSAEEKIIWMIGFVNLTCLAFVFAVFTFLKSSVLQAYVVLSVFDLLSLGTALVSYWTSSQQQKSGTFSYGYDRMEVLAVFASTVLAQLGAAFIIKESLERLLAGDVSSLNGWFLLASTVVLLSHMLVLYGVQNRPLTVVMASSGSSWLQEHTADISHAICRVVPGLSRFLLPRVNPLALLGVVSYCICLLNYFVVDQSVCEPCDSLLALCVAFMTIGTMFPLAANTGRILLQTSPTHVLPQLDKCLREASTLDGVLEVADDKFWQLSFTKMAGSVVVRVRRDADEQLVLAHVTDRLFPIIPDLTVQVNKDTSWRPTIQ